MRRREALEHVMSIPDQPSPALDQALSSSRVLLEHCGLDLTDQQDREAVAAAMYALRMLELAGAGASDDPLGFACGVIIATVAEAERTAQAAVR